MEIASLFARIGADLSGLEKGLAQTETMLVGAGKKMTTLGGDLTRNLTLPLAALGGVAAKSAIDLDKEMRNIQSISKSTDSEISELSGTFVDMSTDMRKTTDSAKNLAAGFYQIQSSGFEGSAAMDVLEASTKAGSAGLASTATAAEAIAASLNAYGESADQAGAISDVLFETVNRGVVTFGELSGSLSNVIGVAAQAGVSIETVGAAVATMTKQGMEGAEATTALNQLILGLIKPSEDLATAIDSLGYSSGQAMLDALGLQGTLQALSDAGFNSTESLAELFPNVRALRAALSLTGAGAQMFVEDLEAMENAAGATDAAFQEQTKSIASQLKNLTNELTALGIELAGVVTPAATEMVGKLKDLTEGFRAMDVEAQKNVLMWVGIAVAAGPVLKIVGLLVTGWGTLAGAVSAALPVLAAAGTALSTWAAPIVGVIAVLGGVAIAWNNLRDTVEKGRQSVTGTWSKFFDDQIKGGKTAAQIATEYAAAQARVKQQLDESNAVARLFINEQELLREGTEAAAAAILSASDSYGNYLAAMKQAGVAAESLTQAQYNLEKGITNVRDAAETQDGWLASLSSTKINAAEASAEMLAAEQQLHTETQEGIEAFRHYAIALGTIEAQTHSLETAQIDVKDEIGRMIDLFANAPDAEMLSYYNAMQSIVSAYERGEINAREAQQALEDLRTAMQNGQPVAETYSGIVHNWGLEFANLKTNASGALTNLQNLLAFLQSHPGLLNAGNQRSFLPALEPPGAPGPTGPYTPPPTTDGGTSSGGTGPGFDIKAAGGDTFNIHINDTMAAALVLAEMDIRRRGRLALRMGG